jgi:hypothetical protein
MHDYSSLPSEDFCTRRFPHYASFAVLPLYATVVSIEDPSVRLWYSYTAGSAHEWTVEDKASMERFINKLAFDDHDFFTIDDYQLFFPIHRAAFPLTREQIEQDRRELLAEVAKPDKMTRDHAKSMLKAVEFWELRYDTKYREWNDRINRAVHEHLNPSNSDEVDEGYSSE